MQKYWIETYGKDYWVFTEAYDADDLDDGITISAPFHSESSDYYRPQNLDDDSYTDFIDYPDAWFEWINLTIKQRCKYVKDFIKEKENNSTMLDKKGVEMLNALRIENRAIEARFVAFEGVKKAPSATIANPQENEMNTSTNTLRHFESRLRDVYHKHDNELEKHFRITEPEPPKTLEEAIERLTAGNFTARPKENMRSYHNWLDHLQSWRAPDEQPDQDGYKKASDALSAAFTRHHDYLQVEEGKDLPKRIETFQKETFH